MAGSFPKSFEYILGLKSLTPAFTAIRSFVTSDVPSNVPANQNISEQIYYNMLTALVTFSPALESNSKF